MELRQIEYVVVLSETLHFGRAAEILGVGQPAVSQQVARLERELGVVLFERSSRSVRLSSAGERFVTEARIVLAGVERARSAASSTPRTAPRLRLGTSAGLGQRLDRLLLALRSSSPSVDVELVRRPTAARLAMVRAGQLDCTFVRGVESASDVDVVHLWDDALVVALPADHPAARADVVSLADLADLPLRLVRRSVNPPLVDLVMAACAAAGVEPRVSSLAPGLEETLAAVGSGAAWTVLYEAHAQGLRGEHVVFRPTTAPGLRISTALAVPLGSNSPSIHALVRACLDGAAH